MADEHYDVKAGLADVNQFDVVGVSIITNNQKGAEDINALWETFFTTKVGQKVSNKTDDMIYAVYSDYVGDHEQPYRLTIGYRVPEAPSESTVAEGLHRVCVVDQSYAVLSATGKQPQALIETWTAIWSSDLERSYATDFELYGPRFFEEGVNEVLVHIGVDEATT